MMELIKTGVWFLRRPTFWPHAACLFVRRLSKCRESAEEQIAARQWAANRAVPLINALKQIGLATSVPLPELPSVLLEEARSRAQSATVKMGGPGDINLLYAAIVLSGAERIVETGVAYGWSSLAALAAVQHKGKGTLVSVDMPYPKMNNEAWVGVVVPEHLRAPWILLREPDRFGLKKAIARLGGTIDLCHYDSDKSYPGRAYAYPLLWTAIRKDGIFISDDIQDNFAFRDFIERWQAPFAVTEYEGKYVGIARKI
jgi:predicted O-methyltransferase YrrM